MEEAIVGGVVGAFVAALATWLFRRVTMIDTFFTKAVGATYALKKAEGGTGSFDDAKYFAGELPPLADTLGFRVRRLGEPAAAWAAALSAGDLKAAKAAQSQFSTKARFAGFGFTLPLIRRPRS